MLFSTIPLARAIIASKASGRLVMVILSRSMVLTGGLTKRVIVQKVGEGVEVISFGGDDLEAEGVCGGVEVEKVGTTVDVVGFEGLGVSAEGRVVGGVDVIRFVATRERVGGVVPAIEGTDGAVDICVDDDPSRSE